MRTPQTETDPLAIDAASLIDTTEDETADEPESESAGEAQTEGEGEQEGLIDEEGDETPEEETPEEDLIPEEGEAQASPLALSEAVAKALPEAERKRYEQHVAGIAKIEKKLGEREEVLKAEEGLMNSYKALDQGVSNKETAASAAQYVIDQINKAHGFNFSISDGSQPEKKKDETAGEDDFNSEYESERKLFDKAKATAETAASKAKKEAKEEAKAEILQELGVDPAELKEFFSTRKTDAQKAQDAAKADALTPKIIQTLKVRDGGWTPSADDVKEILRKNPGLADKPSDALNAVRAALIKDRDKHFAATKPRGPEALTNGKAPGKEMPSNPLDVTAASLLGL